MARAVLEGISYSLYSCVELLRENGVSVADMALCGGGGKSLFWQEMLCDLYGVPIKTMVSDEGAALGAAILGGCAAGVYASVADGCERAVRVKASIEPNEKKHREYLKYYEQYEGLYPVLRERFFDLQLL